MGSVDYKGYNDKFVVLIVSEKPGGKIENYGRPWVQGYKGCQNC